jgi:[citrate (pro-3S)-lyase] ligase
MVSDYLFPAYFTGLQAKTDIQARLDAHLFAGLIAPALKIEARFTGSEPFCPVTLKYNQAMKKIFPAYNIDFHEFERIKNRDQAIISASRARKLLALDVPYKELEQLKELKDILVPASLGFLKTSRGRQVIDRIRSLHREHKQARKYVKELDTPIDKALDTPIDVPVDGATNADS